MESLSVRLKAFESHETGDCHLSQTHIKIDSIPLCEYVCSVLFFVCVLLLFILCAIRYFCLLSQIWVRENCCFIGDTLSPTSNVCANASSINMPFSCHRTETKAFQLVHTHATRIYYIQFECQISTFWNPYSSVFFIFYRLICDHQ